MAQIRVRLAGYGPAMRVLNNVGSQRILIRPMRESIGYVKGRAMMYPPERPYQTYVRTFRLQHGWKGKMITRFRGVRGYLYNTTRYGPWVMREGMQRAVHVSRWHTEDTLLEASERRIVGFFDAQLRLLVGRGLPGAYRAARLNWNIWRGKL